jgi:hypothetical protein
MSRYESSDHKKVLALKVFRTLDDRKWTPVPAGLPDDHLQAIGRLSAHDIVQLRAERTLDVDGAAYSLVAAYSGDFGPHFDNACSHALLTRFGHGRPIGYVGGWNVAMQLSARGERFRATGDEFALLHVLFRTDASEPQITVEIERLTATVSPKETGETLARASAADLRAIEEPAQTNGKTTERPLAESADLTAGNGQTTASGNGQTEAPLVVTANETRLSPSEQNIRDVLKNAGHRMTTDRIIAALEVKHGAASTGTTKNALAGMVRNGHLDNRRDVKPAGYGLPEWK